MTVSSHVSRALPHALLAGGRMTKWKGRVASLSPAMADLRGSVSAVALAGALALAGGALLAPGIVVAGSCSGSGGTYSCSGAASSGSDSTQTLTATTLAVTTSAGFGISTASGNALSLTGTNGLSFTDANSSAITGTTNGIYAGKTSGTGAMSITTTGQVTGGTGKGIYARGTSLTSTNLTISTASVSGATGIWAGNKGTGALSITATGTVTGTLSAFGSYGIRAKNENGTDLSIVATDVYSGGNGIFAVNTGSTGALSVTTTGSVTATNGVGISATNSGATGTDVTVNAVDVYGSNGGIRTFNYGTGTTSVTVSGTVTGSGNDALVTQSKAGQTVTINLLSTANLSTVSGLHTIQDTNGNATVTIDNATVTGNVDLANGADTLNITSGTDLSGITYLEGGIDSNIDTLNLNTGFGTGSLRGWDVINLDASAADFTVAASLATAGNVNVLGTGTVTLSGTNTLTGTTTVSGGTLLITGTLSRSALAIGSGTTASITSGTMAGVISGAGSLVKTGSGTVILTAANTLTGTTTISGGTLSLTGAPFLSDGSLASSDIGIASGATLTASTGTLGGVISGAGSLVKTGSGTLVVSGTNTLTGTTTVSGGTLSVTGSLNDSDFAVASGGILSVSSTGTLTNSDIALANGSLLSAESGTLGGVISGYASFVKTGSGTLVVSGTNTFSGLTWVQGGTLSVTGSLDSSYFQVSSGATLSVTGGTIGSYIYGAGDLVKTGSGTLLISGTSNYNTLSGTTTVSGGTLRITGLLNSSAVTVASGAILEGTGSIGTLTAQSGSNVYAGDSAPTFGALSVVGNATLEAGSTLTISVYGTGSAEHSQLIVGGSASLAGDLFVDVTDGNTGSGALATGGTISNVLVTSGGITGAFASVTDNSVLFDFTAVTNGNAMDLAITGSDVTVTDTTSSTGMRPADGAAGVIDTLIADGTSGDMQTVVDAFGGLTTETAVANAVYQTLPSLSGGTANVTKPGSAASNQARSRGGNSRSRSNAGLGLANGEAWLSPLGGWAHQSQLDDATGFDARFYGMIGGADAEVAPGLRLGLAFAYIQTRIDSTSDIVENSLTVDSYEASAYGTWEVTETVSLLGDLSLGRNEYDGTRHMSFATLNRTAEASYGGYGFTASTSVEKRFRLAEALTFTPSVGLHYQASWDEGYAETGANALNLQVDGQRTHSLSSGLDGQIDYTLANGVELSAKGGVAYDLINDRSRLTVAYQGAAANSFQVDGPMGSPWTGHAGVGVLAKLDSGVDVSAAYTLGAGDGLSSHTAGLRAKWAF